MGFGAVSSGLCVAFPHASLAIDAAFSGLEAITLGIKENKDIKSIVVDTTLSVAFSVVTSGKGDVFSDETVRNSVKSSFDAIKNAFLPSQKKKAKKLLFNSFKKILKKTFKNQIESTAYWGIDRGNRWLLGNMYDLEL